MCIGIKINLFVREDTKYSEQDMLTESASLSWPQHARAYSSTLTNSSVPSKYSAFCNHFGTGHQGKSQHEPKHQQRSSICCTSRPDTKALSQKTHIFTLKHILHVSNAFILMLQNTKTFKLKEPSVQFFPTKKAHLFADLLSVRWTGAHVLPTPCAYYSTDSVLSAH